MRRGEQTQKPIRGYRDLVVWQRSMELCSATYRATATFPDEERYGLVSQMRRAAVSIPSNIAEGHGRLTTNEYRHFLGVARGSLKELETQILIARDLGYLDGPGTDCQLALAEETARMLSALTASLRTRGRTRSS